MLSRLSRTKDRLHNADAAVRRKAVEALTPEQAQAKQEELVALATTDPDAHVRDACVGRIDQPQLLTPLLQKPTIASLAATRIAELLAGTTTDSALLSHPLVLPIVLPALSATLALPLIAKIDDEAWLVDQCFAVKGEVRDAILARITSSKALGTLERKSRNRDKSINRYARISLDGIRHARQTGEAAALRLGELLDALERSDRGSPQRQHALLLELRRTYSNLQASHELLRAAGESPSNMQKIDQRIAVLPPPPPLEPAKVLPPGPSPFFNLAKQCSELQHAMAGGAALVGITGQRQALTTAWLEAADRRKPTKEQQQIFESVSHAFQEYATSAARADAYPTPEFSPLPEALPRNTNALNQLWRELPARRRALESLRAQLDDMGWPQWAQPTDQYRNLKQLATQLAQDVRRLRDHQDQIAENLTTLTATLSADIEAGMTDKASATLIKARALSRSLPPQAGKELIAKLNSEAAKLSELRDWQTFATSPKRQTLCEKIRELSERPLDPQNQADRIKQLRSEWNALGPISKRQDRKLAEQFNQLAEIAFEPCRSYFAEQARARQANLQQRHQLCEQLRDYLTSTHWDFADMKAAEQILRTARTEWRRFHPVDRNPGKKVEIEFETLQGQLHQRIKDVWNANLEDKQAIVREAKALVEDDDAMAEKINAAKALQQRWKSIGATPRKADQKLWQAFRQACDAVFAQRDAAREQADQSLQQALRQTTALMEEIRIEVADATANNATRDFIRDARSRFAQLPQIPQRALQKAQRDFDELLRHYSALLKQQQANKRRDQLRQLRSWDTAVDKFERARAAGTRVIFDAPASCFEDRVANAGAAAIPISIEALREQVVAAELLAELNSPNEDKTLRLKIQVDRLNVGMGKNIEPPDPLKLAEVWCAMGPKSWNPEADAQCAGLRERLFIALEKALEKSP